MMVSESNPLVLFIFLYLAFISISKSCFSEVLEVRITDVQEKDAVENPFVNKLVALLLHQFKNVV